MPDKYFWFLIGLIWSVAVLMDFRRGNISAMISSMGAAVLAWYIFMEKLDA